ncbi:MAG: NAD(P)/FAD-dependent oxidoreductase [Ramlibacter sp.]|nr:NAD(P)/FAD-dependent oxidoreductase [Ramlibacter sp.]
MIRLSEIKLTLAEAEQPEPVLTAAACRILGLSPREIARVDVFKRSFDARKADLVAVFIVDVALADPAQEPALLAKFAANPHIAPAPDMIWRAPVAAPASQPLRPVVVGFGPCGIFAALVLAQMGFKPIVLERGKPVRERTRDTWGLWRKSVLEPESNVQFGEGGAVTFSDG